jgi:glycosyltransferase involved in cell wall biosynthesis
MVGGNDGGILPEWKALVQKLGLEDKVLFHGQKTGAELDEMFDLCDLGVNSMGLYRKDFATTSELKVREYAARGLPFLCAVQDPALLNAEEPMWMWITNDDSIPDMQAIVDFALQMRSDNTIANKLRTYAKEHMTWESQYKKIFQEI